MICYIEVYVDNYNWALQVALAVSIVLDAWYENDIRRRVNVVEALNVKGYGLVHVEYLVAALRYGA